MWSEQRKCGMNLYGSFGRDVCWIRKSQTGTEEFRGTYEQCVAWLKRRACW